MFLESISSDSFMVTLHFGAKIYHYITYEGFPNFQQTEFVVKTVNNMMTK